MKNFIKKTKKYLLYALFLQLSTCCYAQYEVYSAKTIKNTAPQAKNYADVEYDELDNFSDTEYELKKYSNDDTFGSEIGNKVKSLFTKKDKNKESDVEVFDIEEPTVENNVDLENSQTEIDTQTKIKKTKNKPRQTQEEIISEDNVFQVNADRISYDEEEGNVYATGNVEIIAHKQGTTIKANNATLDKKSQTIKLTGNVKVLKDGVEMVGDYLVVDLNEQNVLINEPVVSAYQFEINAQEGYLIANDIQMMNGSITRSKEGSYAIETSGFLRYENVAMDYVRPKGYVDRSYIDRTTKQSYRIDAKKIILTSYKDHDSLVLKKSNLYYNNHKIISNSDIEIISDKQRKVIDISSPEAGSLRNFGVYVGYGWVNKLPNGHTLKLMPVLTHGNNKIGVGVVGRYRSQNNLLEAGWTTSTTNLIVKGRYRLAPDTYIKYGRNTYISEGFMGQRRPGYAAQLEYKKTYKIPELDNLRFDHGIYIGAFSDYSKKKKIEDTYSTMRFRYSAELRKNLFEYKNEEQDLRIKISAMAQGAATIYGSGHPTGVIRFGPFLTTRVKFWESSIGYMFAGTHGESPFVFDRYRYGKSAIMLNEKFNLGKYVAVGFRAYVNPLKDNYENKLLTESRLYTIVGPQDLKLALSYDFIRDVAHLEFMFLLGSDSSRINFEELITKDIENKKQKRDFYKNAKKVKIQEPENI